MYKYILEKRDDNMSFNKLC